MTQLIGLAGPARAGKDTVADILVEEYGWAKFSFSDELYRQVSDAFGITEEFLRERSTKEVEHPRLALIECMDADAFGYLRRAAREYDRQSIWGRIPLIRSWYMDDVNLLARPRSPRRILQWWGTEYRRRQDPDYWIRCAARVLDRYLEEGVPGVANTSVRFPNETEWVRSRGGTVVHVMRPGYGPESDYVAEQPVPIEDKDYLLDNDAGLLELQTEVWMLHETLDLFGASRA